MEATSQVWETVKRTASIASELEIRLGAQSITKEQLHAIAQRAQRLNKQAM